MLIGGVSKAQEDNTAKNVENMVSQIEVNDDLKTHFTTDLLNYFKAFNKEDWDGVIDMIYPKLFDLITKEQMVQFFSQLKELGMDMKIDFMKVDNISEVISYESSKFCRVYYNGILTIKISGIMLEDKEELKQDFISAYGLDNVKYDSINEKFDIDGKKSMMAISRIDSNNWTYIEYNEQQEEMLYQLIPREVLEQLLN